MFYCFRVLLLFYALINHPYVIFYIIYMCPHWFSTSPYYPYLFDHLIWLAFSIWNKQTNSTAKDNSPNVSNSSTFNARLLGCCTTFGKALLSVPARARFFQFLGNLHSSIAVIWWYYEVMTIWFYFYAHLELIIVRSRNFELCNTGTFSAFSIWVVNK